MSIKSLLQKKGNATDEQTGKASNEDPKSTVLDSIKQDFKADEVGAMIDHKLLNIVASLLTKGITNENLQAEMI